MAVYGYRRVSTDEQEDGASLDQQTQKIMGLAMMAGLGEPTIYQDTCSGSIPLDQRASGKTMLDTLRKGDTVIVSKLDRIFRNATDALSRADEFKQRGISLYLIDMGADPVTQNGTSRMFFGMLALMAEFERDRLRERLADGRVGKKAKGGHIGGTAPFGYRVEGKGKEAILIEEPAQQEAIEGMRKMHAEGYSLRKIADAVTAQGHKVSHETVKSVLARQ